MSSSTVRRRSTIVGWGLVVACIVTTSGCAESTGNRLTAEQVGGRPDEMKMAPLPSNPEAIDVRR